MPTEWKNNNIKENYHICIEKKLETQLENIFWEIFYKFK